MHQRKEPESPINISAGWELNHKMQLNAPQIAEPIIANFQQFEYLVIINMKKKTACPAT